MFENEIRSSYTSTYHLPLTPYRLIPRGHCCQYGLVCSLQTTICLLRKGRFFLQKGRSVRGGLPYMLTPRALTYFLLGKPASIASINMIIINAIIVFTIRICIYIIITVVTNTATITPAPSPPQYTTIYHHIPPYATIYHRIPPYATIYHHILPQTTVYHHIPPYTIINYHIPPYTAIYHHIPRYTTIYHSIRPYTTIAATPKWVTGRLETQKAIKQ